MGVTCRCHMSRFSLYDGRISGDLCYDNGGGVRHCKGPGSEVVKAAGCPCRFVGGGLAEIRHCDSNESFCPFPAFEMLFVVVSLLIVRIGLVVV